MFLYNTCMRDCYDTCLIETNVVNGKIRVKGSFKNPITHGFLCPKGQMFPKWVHSQERLKSPLVKRDGKFVEVSWEKAIETVARVLKDLIEGGQEKKILLYQYAGDRGVVNYHFPMRLFHRMGASFLDHAICDRAGQEALKGIYGTAVGMDPEDLKSEKLVVYWGMNPFWTNLHGFQMIKNLGLEVWSVDVYKTQTAKRSDKSFLIKPGSDPEFAAAILKFMVENDLYEKSVENLKGFKGLLEKLSELDIEHLLNLSGVSYEDLEFFARKFHEKRGVIHIGYGFQRGRRGGESVSLVGLIPIVSQGRCSFIYDMKVLDKSYAEGRFLREKGLNLIPQMKIYDYMDNGAIKMLYIYNSNPASTLPNPDRFGDLVRERGIFTVVHDIFMTDTARIADVVLPANTFFERFDIADSYYHSYVSINEPVLKISGKSNREVSVMLAEALGYDDPYLYESEESIIRKVLEDSDLKYEELLKKKILKGKRRESCDPGKVILFGEKVRKAFGRIGEVPEGDLLMITPTYNMTVSSQYHNTYKIDDPSVHISTSDAERLGLRDGEDVVLSSKAGKVVVKLRVDSDVPEGLVISYKAFWKSIANWNVNQVVPEDSQKGYSDAAVYHHFPVNIRRWEG